MTEKEKELYHKIKEESEGFMFDMLFKKNSQGIVEPIKGMTLKLMPDGIPMILDQESANLLNGNSTNDPFASVTTNKSFREISNEIAMESPFGKNSMFYKEEREILKGQIPKL
ncbi:hypothetical protein [Flavobacterium sp.]|uniref:hypothetical protein n=1 Tax=Flavobacterium sp. TaxID=239 RepID=UPI00286EB340|nr:hypothetical protein [Flavobacterium sp.]